ncbi:MAG: PBP1A family penicillin-binding protein [Acidimicrobiia bacterium]|nr:PBP1A family penicillin-binding protein [Acidimicrobiia bacterium]
MRRLSALVAVASLVLASCNANISPLADPGIGELGLTSLVFAADGTILAEWHAEENRVLVDFDELPVELLNAVVAIEDERFWVHPGVDLRAIARALVTNIDAGGVAQGASTITQQYIKNVVLTPEVTLDRKIEEASLALRLEETLTKEEILERYLNTVYFGDGAYGVGQASTHFFGKVVGDLSLGEAALLAGLIQSPSRTDPYDDPEAALARRRVVLTKMAELGWITEDEALAADQEELVLAPDLPPEQARYPYFTEEVKQRLLDDPALGLTPTDRYNALFKGGLRIYTTLDPDTQEAADAAVAAILPDDGLSAALVAIEPATGYVRAIVGGKDFYDPDSTFGRFNLATQGRRQPGSSFKPFVLAAGMEGGMNLSTTFAGGRSIVVQTPSGPWAVENYAGSAFPSLSLLEATVFSVNVVYAQLVNAVGPQAVVDVATAAGITTDLQPFHSIALGAQEVSVLDMASAYGTFAANGVHIDPIFVTSIETSAGVNLYQPVPIVTEAISRDVAQQVTAALSEVVRRGTGQRAQIGRPVAGKTGTSQAHRDAWFVGYTPELSAAVWVGFAEGQISMEPPTTPITVVGGSYPAEIWAAFASIALTGSGFGALPAPDEQGLVTVDIDTSTGFLAGPFCPRQHVQSLQLPAEVAPTVVCPVHNPDGVVGAGSVDVPDVIGKDLAGATSSLQERGFLVHISWSDGRGLTQGTIFNQSPSAGFPAQIGATVELTVAGPEYGTSVPLVLGFTLNEAQIELELIGVGVDIIVEAEADPADASRRSGLVWKQTPVGGSPAVGTVTLWVNP